MKKTISNFRILAALLMAGAAFAACSSSDDIIENQQPANNGKQAYTLTINASKDGAATRALGLVGSAVVASWETTDEIVVTKNGTQIGTLSPTEINGLEATFTGIISGDADINVGDALTLSYHPIASIEGFASQDGTLSGSANSAENYDMAVATVTISGIDVNSKTINVSYGSEESANFVNQTAVVVLSPHASYQSTGGTTNISSLIVSVMMDIPGVGTVTEKIGPFTLSGGQPYYFSLPSKALLAEALAAKYSLSASAVSTLLASATITFTGQQGGVYYLTCDKTGYKFAAGKYYKLDENNFVMTEVNKYAAADKDVYVENQDVSWSNTVTFAVNREIGWKVVGDNVYCGDKQLYFNSGNSMMFASGFVKATDDFIPSWGGTYSLVAPAPTTVTWNLSEKSGYYDLSADDFQYKGVTFAGTEYGTGYIQFDETNDQFSTQGPCTFIAPAGKKFTSIVVTAQDVNINAPQFGWSSGTWSNANGATEVTIVGGAQFNTEIVFTLVNAD